MKTWLLDNRTAMVKAFFAAVVIPFLFALIALEIYFANTADLSGAPGIVLFSVFVLASIGTFLLFVLQLPFLGRKVFPWIATTLLTLGFLLWLQANVFNWNFGPMDGRGIPWKEYRSLGYFELFVYGMVIVMAIWVRRKLFERVALVSSGLIFILLIPVSYWFENS